MNALIGVFIVLALGIGVYVAVVKRSPEEESESESQPQAMQPTAGLVEDKAPELTPPATESEPQPTALKIAEPERVPEPAAPAKPPAAEVIAKTPPSDRRPLILAEGTTGDPDDIPLLAQLAVESNDEIRQAVAASIRRIAQEGRLGGYSDRAIDLAGRLSRDRSSAVRQAAIEALGCLRSAKVIPYLQQGLQDPEPEVVCLASAALDRYKFYPSSDRAPDARQPANAAPRPSSEAAIEHQ